MALRLLCLALVVLGAAASVAPVQEQYSNASSENAAPAQGNCAAPGKCGTAYQVCCAGFAAKGFPCGCHLQDGQSGAGGAAGSACGDCGGAYVACCLGFKAKGFPCKCDVEPAAAAAALVV